VYTFCDLSVENCFLAYVYPASTGNIEVLARDMDVTARASVALVGSSPVIVFPDAHGIVLARRTGDSWKRQRAVSGACYSPQVVTGADGIHVAALESGSGRILFRTLRGSQWSNAEAVASGEGFVLREFRGQLWLGFVGVARRRRGVRGRYRIRLMQRRTD